jgi:HSP20 family molecular chaperone IbpA
MTTQSVSVQEAKTNAVPVKINTVDVESLFDRAKEIYEAITRRAYEIFNGRGRRDGYDLQDWLSAEQELLHPLSLEMTESEDYLTARTEVPGFSEKDLKVNLEPRRLVITGKIEESSEQKTGETMYSSRRSNEIFHTLDLPAEVNPEKASATLNQGILEIQLPKVTTTKTSQVEVKTA